MASIHVQWQNLASSFILSHLSSEAALLQSTAAAVTHAPNYNAPTRHANDEKAPVEQLRQTRPVYQSGRHGECARADMGARAVH